MNQTPWKEDGRHKETEALVTLYDQALLGVSSTTVFSLLGQKPKNCIYFLSLFEPGTKCISSNTHFECEK